jgi:hypothetical protein
MAHVCSVQTLLRGKPQNSHISTLIAGKEPRCVELVPTELGTMWLCTATLFGDSLSTGCGDSLSTPMDLANRQCF